MHRENLTKWRFAMVGWGAAVGVAVFVLYLRDPYAGGIRPSQFESLRLS
jgi:hypothetical protein